MSENVTNDNKAAKKTARQFKRKPVRGFFDAVILIFSTLFMNLFSLAVPVITLQVYDRILAFHSTGTLQVLCAGVAAVVLLDIIMKLSRSALIGWSSARFEHAAYTGTLRHLMSARLLPLGRFSAGEQFHKLSAIAQLKSFYSGQSLVSLIDLPFVLVFLGFIAYLSGPLVIVPLVLLGVFGIYSLFLGASMKRALESRSRDDDERINFISEILDRVHTIKMGGLEPAFQRRHEALQGKSVHEAHILGARNAQGFNAASMFTQIMMVAMISIGALMVLDGQITMGVLIACVLLSGRVMQPVQRALTFWLGVQEFRLAKRKIDEVLALPLQEKGSAEDLKPAKGKLEIKNLSFAYEEGGEPLLENLNLILQPGRAISLGGPPGDGKTTLLKLIAGLYEPTAGEVFLDGTQSGRYPFGMLAKYVGYLPSEADIFQGSIMDNLTSFRPVLEEGALEIAGYLGIDKVVSKLPQGYQTKLFDGPADPLTPGMKQRLTIGRVLVNRPRLLLFDFADKSLDKEGYNHVFRLLGQLKGQVSMILVSNDRNILHLAQEEYVIEDRKLVAMDDSRFSKSGQLVQPLKELRS